jgi:choline dehydrogenase
VGGGGLHRLGLGRRAAGPRRLEDDRDFGDRPYHGRGGPIPIRRLPEEAWGAVDVALAEAATAAGEPWAADHNAPGSTGVSPYALNAGDHGRVSTADGYLEPARGRANLTIRGDALVDRVRIAGGRAVGVVVRTAAGEGTIDAGEVVLCAGAIHTPAILLRSGIGPAAELRTPHPSTSGTRRPWCAPRRASRPAARTT